MARGSGYSKPEQKPPVVLQTGYVRASLPLSGEVASSLNPHHQGMPSTLSTRAFRVRRSQRGTAP
jgi:hypothetical protein